MWRRRKPRVSQELGAKEMAALVGAAQVSEQEIRRWHTDFLNHYPSGHLNKKTFIEYFQKLHRNIGPENSFDKIFEMIDADHDGMIDFNELLVVIVLMNCENCLETRLTFALNMWDESGDGQIDQTELASVISAIYDYTGVPDRKDERDPQKRAAEIIAKLDISGDKKLSKAEFITGCKNDPVIRNLLAPNA